MPDPGTLRQIRLGLRNNLAAIEGIQVSAYMLSAPTPPAIHVFPSEIEYDQAMVRGLDRYVMIVQAVVAQTLDRGMQELLDEFLEPVGDRSVKAVIEADPTLGGAAEDLRVIDASGYRVYTFDGRPPCLGCEWTVEVWA